MRAAVRISLLIRCGDGGVICDHHASKEPFETFGLLFCLTCDFVVFGPFGPGDIVLYLVMKTGTYEMGRYEDPCFQMAGRIDFTRYISLLLLPDVEPVLSIMPSPRSNATQQVH